jgi:hypothetical protein
VPQLFINLITMLVDIKVLVTLHNPLMLSRLKQAKQVDKVNREVVSKEVANREADNREADSREADNREADNKEADNKEADMVSKVVNKVVDTTVHNIMPILKYIIPFYLRTESESLVTRTKFAPSLV